MNIPEHGMGKQEILKTLERYKQKDLPWRSGKVLAYTYDPGPDAEEVTKAAYALFLGENALDPTAYPSVLKLETEVVRMVANLLRGDGEVVGNFTSGGTESILLAVKTARDKARAERPEITVPEMVLPRTGHPAFHKAGQYFGVKPVVVPFERDTFRADVDAMRRAITKNTILLVGSAPGYGHGVVDPIAEIGALAQEKDLLFHVDACVGGIQLSFMRRMGGYSVPDFDFSVPGVTSISADLHKYGYAAKNASVILYRNKNIRRHQIFACTSSTTYVVVNSTMLSSKSAGPIAGAWAVLHYLGEEGYRRMIREVMDATQRMIEGINATEDLRVLGQPQMSMFCFASDAVNVYQLADEMSERGWYLQPQLSTEFSPPNLHISVNHNTVALVDPFLADLRESLRRVRECETPLNIADVRAQVEQALRETSPDTFREILAMGGIRGTTLPEKMAVVNSVLDALPDPAAESLLIEFINDFYV
jgi:sphinganine-1-phosphate aldolase